MIFEKAALQAFGNTDSSASPTKAAAMSSARKAAVARTTVGGSMIARAVPTMPLVPGGGGSILEPGDMTMLEASTEADQAFVRMILGLIGSAVAMRARSGVSNRDFCQEKVAGGSILMALG